MHSELWICGKQGKPYKGMSSAYTPSAPPDRQDRRSLLDGFDNLDFAPKHVVDELVDFDVLGSGAILEVAEDCVVKMDREMQRPGSESNS